MNRRMWCGVVLAVSAMLGISASGCDRSPEQPGAAAAPSAGNLRIGDKLPDFTLSTLGGESVHLADSLDGRHYVCVVWHSPACPCAQNCAIAVRDALSGADYADVRFVGVASGPESDLDWWRADLNAQNEEGILTYPVAIDRDGSVRALYGAKRTPTVWLADKEGHIRFWGAPETTLDPTATDYQLSLKAAIDDLKAGREVATPRVEPIGCLIAE